MADSFGIDAPTSVKSDKTSRINPIAMVPNPTSDSMVAVLSVLEAAEETKRPGDPDDVEPELTRLRSWLDGRSSRSPPRIRRALRTTRRRKTIAS